MPESKAKGCLIIIGGHEDKTGDRVILKETVRRIKKNKTLLLVTVATSLPEEVEADYRKVFGELGVDNMQALDIRIREDAMREENVQKILDASVIFFTGGDQLRISSQIGDSLVFRCMRDAYYHGATIVGTSAGAAAMCETMITYGTSDSTDEIENIGMGPGLGFMNDAVIDTHFAERGRIGRLLGGVAQNPRNLGLGIDEDTAIIVEEDNFRVIGAGAVYVVDGSEISYSSLSEEEPVDTPSIFGAKLHLLGDGDLFDLVKRVPISIAAVSMSHR